jgi:hypothetical protein
MLVLAMAAALPGEIPSIRFDQFNHLSDGFRHDLTSQVANLLFSCCGQFSAFLDLASIPSLLTWMARMLPAMRNKSHIAGRCQTSTRNSPSSGASTPVRQLAGSIFVAQPSFQTEGGENVFGRTFGIWHALARTLIMRTIG